MWSKGGDGITLRAYVSALESVSGRELPESELMGKGVRARCLRELQEAGLVANSGRTIGGGVMRMAGTLVLSPAGASALVEWRDYLRRNSWWGRAGFFAWQLLLMAGSGFAGAALQVALGKP